MNRFSDRPYVRCFFMREVRRVAGYKRRAHQFTDDQYDQFDAKCRTESVTTELCDFAADDEEFCWDCFKKWLNTNWSKVRALVEEISDVPLNHPQMHYNVAPSSRGRKALRARGPRYQDDARFQEDKELFEKELRGETEDTPDFGPLM